MPGQDRHSSRAWVRRLVERYSSDRAYRLALRFAVVLWLSISAALWLGGALLQLTQGRWWSP